MWMYERAIAPISVAKMPNCAAPPKSAILGLAISGPKSVMAPTAIKMNSGNSPELIPKLNTMPKNPLGPAIASPGGMGMLASSPPKAMGIKSSGSNCFLMPSHNRKQHTAIIVSCCQVTV